MMTANNSIALCLPCLLHTDPDGPPGPLGPPGSLTGPVSIITSHYDS